MRHNELGQQAHSVKKNCSLFIVKNSISLFISLLFFFALVFFCKLVLPGASSIELTLQTDHEDTIQIFCSNGATGFYEKFSVSSQVIEKDKISEVRLHLSNMPVQRMRIDTGSSPGIMKIYRIILHSHFARTRVLNPAEIFRLFQQASPGTAVQLKDNFVEITSTTEDPYFIADTPLLRGGILLLYGLPLLASTLLFLILQKFEIKRFPAFADIFTKRPSTGENIVALDGLRGIAAIMVVADQVG